MASVAHGLEADKDGLAGGAGGRYTEHPYRCPMPESPESLLHTLVRVRQLLRAAPGTARLPVARLRPILSDLVGLVDQLRPYLRHADDCAAHELSEVEMYGRRWPRPCTCGLDRLIDEKAVLVHLRPDETRAGRLARHAARNA